MYKKTPRPKFTQSSKWEHIKMYLDELDACIKQRPWTVTVAVVVLVCGAYQLWT